MTKQVADEEPEEAFYDCETDIAGYKEMLAMRISYLEKMRKKVLKKESEIKSLGQQVEREKEEVKKLINKVSWLEGENRQLRHEVLGLKSEVAWWAWKEREGEERRRWELAEKERREREKNEIIENVRIEEKARYQVKRELQMKHEGEEEAAKRRKK